MTSLLIIEGNTPDLVAQGYAWAEPFVQTFAAIAPEVWCERVNPYDGPLAAELFAAADGVVFTGAGVAWAADAPEGASARAAFTQALEAGKPIWGSCNGMQLAAVMLGGSVRASPNGLETGFALGLMPAAPEHPMARGRRAGDAALCIHRDEVEDLPEGAQLIVSNAHSPVQGFVYERQGVCFWGTQYHPELTPHDLARLLKVDGIFVGCEALISDLETSLEDAEVLARLGVETSHLQHERRAAELIAWLALVEGRTPFPTAS